MRKDDLAFQYYVQSLRDSNQTHLAKILSPEAKAPFVSLENSSINYELSKELVETLERSVIELKKENESLKSDRSYTSQPNQKSAIVNDQWNAERELYIEQITLMESEMEKVRNMQKKVNTLGFIILCPLIIAFAFHIMKKWK